MFLQCNHDSNGIKVSIYSTYTFPKIQFRDLQGDMPLRKRRSFNFKVHCQYNISPRNRDTSIVIINITFPSLLLLLQKFPSNKMASYHITYFSFSNLINPLSSLMLFNGPSFNLFLKSDPFKQWNYISKNFASAPEIIVWHLQDWIYSFVGNSCS